MKFFVALLFVATTSTAFSAPPTSLKQEFVVPNSILAFQLTTGYGALLEEAEQHAKRLTLRENVAVMAVEYPVAASGREQGGKVVLTLGAPTHRWPTRVYKVGEITADVSFFPDGINNFIVNNMKFHPVHSVR